MKSHRQVITMISQSAQKRQRLYTNPYNESTITTNGPKLKADDKSSTWEALYPEQCTLLMRSLPEFQAMLHSEEYVQMAGSEMESSLTPSCKSTGLSSGQLSCMHVRPGQYIYKRHAKRLNHFHLSCLRKLLIKWQDKIPDTEVLKKAGIQSTHTVLKLAQLRWIGNAIRMPDERFPKKVFYGELQEGKRPQCGQKQRYKTPSKPL